MHEPWLVQRPGGEDQAHDRGGTHLVGVYGCPKDTSTLGGVNRI